MVFSLSSRPTNSKLACDKGPALSSFLFAFYLNDILDYRRNVTVYNFILFYADDILLLSEPVSVGL
jgi:hypothetical protein